MLNPIPSNEKYPFQLPNLPFPSAALEPHVSAETFSYHHGKHHNAYVTNLNNLIKDNEYSSLTLEEIIFKSHKDASKTGIFNNAAQIWNHTFYWHCMKPNGGGKPEGTLMKAIERDFGSFEKFLEEFKNAALTQFGSGWAWLVSDNGNLKIVKTSNAELPLVNGQKPLLTIDVWEHAYYVDYRNARASYVETFFSHIVNWGFAEINFAG